MAYTETVKFYDDAKGFGFIIEDAGGEIFFHKTGISKSDQSFTPHDGDKVLYEKRPS